MRTLCRFLCLWSQEKKAKYVYYSEFDIGPISNFAVAANFILSLTNCGLSLHKKKQESMGSMI